MGPIYLKQYVSVRRKQISEIKLNKARIFIIQIFTAKKT